MVVRVAPPLVFRVILPMLLLMNLYDWLGTIVVALGRIYVCGCVPVRICIGALATLSELIPELLTTTSVFSTTALTAVFAFMSLIATVFGVANGEFFP